MSHSQLKTSELDSFIDSLSSEFFETAPVLSECHVLANLSSNEYEETNEVVYQGYHCIQKRIKTVYDLGTAYEYVYALQQSGNKCDGFFPRIFVCSRHDDILEVIQEYAEGQTLMELLARGALSDDAINNIFMSLCSAVCSMSNLTQEHFVHRDIKPSNICVMGNPDSEENLSVMLIDLSLARIYDESLDYDVRCFGTRSYAPPEQFGYRQTDTRADVYALGRVLYALWVGENPVGELTAYDCEGCGIPPEIAVIIENATKFDPDQRYQSVEALRDAYCQAFSHTSYAVLSDHRNAGTNRGPVSLVASFLCERIPLSDSAKKYLSWIGYGWNVALIFMAFYLIVVSMDAMVDVLFLGSFANHVTELGLSFVSIYLVYLPLLYFVSYKEPLYRLARVKRAWPLAKTVSVYVVCLVAAAVLMSIVPHVFLP